MQEILDDNLNKNEEKDAKIITQIYSPRKGPDSPGGFRFKRAGKINR